MTSRRNMIKQLAVLSGGLLMLPEVRTAHSNNEAETQNTSRAMLMAFAATVVPCGSAPHEDFAGIFDEKIYGFRKFRWLLLTDLRNRSHKLFGNNQFYHLSPAKRHAVIQDALNTKGIMKRLYSGAIQIVQIGFYSGYRLEPEGCTEISFTSQFRFEPPSYSSSSTYFGKSLTTDGHLA